MWVETGREIDPAKPLLWKTRRLFQNRPTSEAFQLVERLTKYKGHAEGVEIYYMTSEQELQYTVADSLPQTGSDLSAVLERMNAFFSNGNLAMTVHRIRFDQGQDFLDWKNQDRIAVDLEKEIDQ